MPLGPGLYEGDGQEVLLRVKSGTLMPCVSYDRWNPVEPGDKVTISGRLGVSERGALWVEAFAVRVV